jgi:hypothetical protein
MHFTSFIAHYFSPPVLANSPDGRLIKTIKRGPDANVNDLT